MSQKKDVDSHHEIIDEEEFVENLLDERIRNDDEQNSRNTDSFKDHQVVYTKQVGCFDFKSILINLIVYTVVLMVTSGLFSGIYLANFWDALITALVMSILNIILKPILVILTLPLTLMTFGLFYIVVNGFLLWIADYIMGPAFEINSFGLAILASVFISLLRMGINHYILKEDTFKVNM